jgi:hypothetical protein
MTKVITRILLPLLAAPVLAQAQQDAELAAVIDDLVAANRILAAQGILPGYGHVSARHPSEPDRYLISRSVAPELVTADDIVVLDLDSDPIDPSAPRSYLERFIHGEIYKVRPDVHAVVHNHSARRRSGPSIIKPPSFSTGFRSGTTAISARQTARSSIRRPAVPHWPPHSRIAQLC